MSRLPFLLRRPAAAAALAVALAAVLTYMGTLGHGFALDDVSEVVRNEHVHSLANLPRIFASGAWDGAGDRNPIYRPLTSATYAVNHALGGLDPLGYHLVNVLLHAGVSLLVLWLALRLRLAPGPAALAALVFAVHPVHVEVVANVAGRKDLLASGFAILAVLAHASAVRRGGAALALAPLAVATALFSKESGVAALGFAVAWDLLIDREAWRQGRRRAAALYAIYAVELALYLLARRAAVGSLGVPLAYIPLVENPLAHATAAVRLLTAVAVIGQGLVLLVFPSRLSADYSYDAIPLVHGPLDPRFLGAAAVLAAIAWGSLRLLRSRPVFPFAAAWYAIALFPASNLLVKVGTVFGERLLYLPSAGFCLALGAAAQGLPAGRAVPLRRIAAVLAVGVLAARSVSYAAAWEDEVSLFTAAVEAQPRSAKAHQLLGAALMEVGRVEEGMRELETAVSALSALPAPPVEARVQLGVAYERAGRLGDAARLYGEVLAARPDEPDALWRLGVVRWRQRDRDEAVRLWERTLALDPAHARAMNDLGIAAFQQGDAARAEALWLRSTQLDPRSAGPWLSLGTLYEQRGDLARARAAWTRFLELARYGVYPGQREAVEERLRATDPARAGARR